jgi:hypothetical protein
LVPVLPAPCHRKMSLVNRWRPRLLLHESSQLLQNPGVSPRITFLHNPPNN